MPPIVASTDVNRPARGVFADATDPTCFHEWQKCVIGGHMDDPGSPGVGARCVTDRRVGFAVGSASVTSGYTACTSVSQQPSPQAVPAVSSSAGGCADRLVRLPHCEVGW